MFVVFAIGVGVAVAIAVWLSSPPPAVIELSVLRLLVVGDIVAVGTVVLGDVDVALAASGSLLILLLLLCNTTLLDDCAEAIIFVTPGGCGCSATVILGEIDIVCRGGDEVANGSTTFGVTPVPIVVVVVGPIDEAIVSEVACCWCC